MNNNIKITIGLSLASIMAVAILFVCKKYTHTCCEGGDPLKEKCGDTKQYTAKE